MIFELDSTIAKTIFVFIY